MWYINLINLQNKVNQVKIFHSFSATPFSCVRGSVFSIAISFEKYKQMKIQLARSLPLPPLCLYIFTSLSQNSCLHSPLLEWGLACDRLTLGSNIAGLFSPHACSNLLVTIKNKCLQDLGGKSTCRWSKDRVQTPRTHKCLVRSSASLQFQCSEDREPASWRRLAGQTSCFHENWGWLRDFALV